MSALAIHPSPTARKMRARRRGAVDCVHYGMGSGACPQFAGRSAAPERSGYESPRGFEALPPTTPTKETVAPLSGSRRGDGPGAPAAGASLMKRPEVPIAVAERIVHPGTAAPARKAAQPAAVRMRLTARGRRVVVALGFALAIAFGGGMGALVQGQDTPVQVETVVVQPGESLWAIAVGVSGPDQDVRDVVEQIRNLNGLQGATLQAGQELTIPVQ